MGDLNAQDFRKIIARRDPRFDGRFFFGVRTTKIYCRVTCPARPKPENITIFKSPSQAERSGYRPCLRCRPDAAPGSRILNGTSNTVARAIRIIDQMTEENFDVETLATSLGVTGRHLRRLFEEHLGASPMEIVLTKRLHLARRLVSETREPLSQVAFAAGFKSIRRFNDAFKNLYDRAPSEFRKKNELKIQPNQMEFNLLVRAPYDWTTVLKYLARHEAYGVERIENDRYIRFHGDKGVIQVRRAQRETELHVSLSDVPLLEIRSLLNKLKALFDTEHNPSHLPNIKEAKDFSPRGIRVPGSFDPFEVAVSIVLSQLVSTTLAKAQLKSLILRYGRRRADFEGRETFIFPLPEELANAPLETIGLTKIKAGALREIARLVSQRALDLTPTADVEITRQKLLNIRGVGPWTTEMIAMRCLGDPNAFPRRDLIVQRALEAKLVREEEWSPSRAYLTHCVWRDASEALSKKKKGN